MELLGKCEIQYVNNLLSSKKAVLRADRDRGDNPYVKFYSVPSEQKLLMRIVGDVKTEEMTSNPRVGAKDRTDIYFFDFQLDNAINILEPFVESLSIEFDDTPRSIPNPTGMEHPDGLSLGEIYTITSFVAQCVANYADKSFSVSASSKLFVEAERKRGNKFHIGINMSSSITSAANGNVNSFELWIDYSDTKRFLHAMKVAKKLLS
jgi:hypothetical protein